MMINSELFENWLKENNLRVLTERNLNRISKGHEKDGYAIISACREVNSTEENNRFTNELRNELRRRGYSYLMVYGGYKELGQDKASLEKSFVVYPYDIGRRNSKDFEVFKNDMIDLATPVKNKESGETDEEFEERKNKRNQDSILICEPGGKPRYISTREGAVDEDEFSGETEYNDLDEPYFTAIKKWNDMSLNRKNHKWDKGQPQRFSLKYAECFIDEPPHSYAEGHTRFCKNDLNHIYKEEYTRNNITEGGLSRIWQHTQNSSKFAIIGSQDKDTKEDRRDELIAEVSKLSHRRENRIGYKPLFGRYEYEDGTIGEELSLIIFNIDKKDALRIAQKLNQESIIWKDADFFGFLTANGEEDGEFSYNQNNMNFSADDIKLYGSRLARHKNKNQQKWFKFVMECYKTDGSRNAVRNMGTKPMREREELFHIYSDNINEGVYKKKKTKHGYITYGTCANPDTECRVFNTLMGSDRFGSSNGGESSSGESSGGVSEAFEEEAVKIAYEMLGGNKVYGYVKRTDLEDSKTKRIWVYDSADDVDGKYGRGTIRRENILKVFGKSKEANVANHYIRKMTPVKGGIIKESITSPYTKIDRKSVMDSDGFYTDYTWYYDEDNGKHFFMFGDEDIYSPDPDYADWECETMEDARDWFDNYNGFEDEDEFNFDED